MRIRTERESGTDALIRSLRAAAVQGERKAAERWASDARRRVRVDTGATKTSITAVGGVVSAGGASRWLEFGTRSQAAHPFLRPARSAAVQPLMSTMRGVFR